LPVEGIGLHLIQALNRSLDSFGMNSDLEWAAIRLLLPNKPRGIPRVDDRRVVSRPIRQILGQLAGLHKPRINPNLAAR